jgi:hypothetical protein
MRCGDATSDTLRCIGDHSPRHVHVYDAKERFLGDLMSSECAESNAGCRARNVVAIRDSRIATPQQVGALYDLRLDSRALAFAITVAKFSCDPKVPFDQFDARSIGNARNASESRAKPVRIISSAPAQSITASSPVANQAD